MGRSLNLEGMRFSRLFVFAKADWKYSGTAHIVWRCLCDCGNIRDVCSSSLTKGATKSCGCWRDLSRFNNTWSRKHGKSRSKEYSMFYSARTRAHKMGLPFSIKLEDIVIPEFCPLLGIPIFAGKHGEYHPNSASIDRKNPLLGYTRDNIWVISFRANEIKNNASLAELKTLTANLERLMQC